MKSIIKLMKVDWLIAWIFVMLSCWSCKEYYSTDHYKMVNNSSDHISLIFFYKGEANLSLDLAQGQAAWLIQNEGFEGRKRTLCDVYPSPFLLRDHDSAYVIRKQTDTMIYYKIPPLAECGEDASVLCRTNYQLSKGSDGGSCVYYYEFGEKSSK